MISRRSFAKTTLLSSAGLLTHPMRSLHAAIPQTRPTSTMPVRFGVNYVPRKRWWYCWLDWEQQAIVDDLRAIAELGVDHIRIQCLWPYFQPGISTVSDRALANLHALLDAADNAQLDVEVTVLNGWMSGLSFLPPWVAPLVNPSDVKAGNIFTDPKVIEAEKLLLHKIADAVGSHKRFLGFDLGNELGVLQTPGSNFVSTRDADAWASEMLRYCDQIAPGKFHVNGIDHVHWFNDYGFSREQIAITGHASVVHSYILFDGVLDHYKYSDAASLHLAEYEIELAYAYHHDPHRRVWVEETGVGSKEMPESYKTIFMEHSLRNMLSTGKLWGVTWWGSHDIDPAIKSFDPYEYDLGLLNLQNKPKPMGLKFASLIAEFKREQPQVAPRMTALVIPDRGLSTKSWPPDWRFAKQFMDLVDRGISPCIVLESRAHDVGYLKERGITNLVPLSL